MQIMIFCHQPRLDTGQPHNLQGWEASPLIFQVYVFQLPSSPLYTITFAGQYSRDIFGLLQQRFVSQAHILLRL